jgi:hemoglobin
MKDIENYNDLLILVNDFYSKLKEDELVKHFFIEVIHLDFDTHIPIIASFWDSILFGTQNYSGNPMSKHIELNKISRLEQKHFDRWLFL